MRHGDAISVLLPTYNSAEYLETAIRSVLEQSYRRYELLVLDDGSTDNTESLVAGFDDERIRYFKLERSGLGATLNRGLELARYPWIARMDADDFAMPGRFEKQVLYLAENPDIAVLSSWYAVFDEGRISFVVKVTEKHSEIVDRLYLHADISHAGCMYRKDTVKAAGGYVHTIAQDYELWNRLRETAQFANLPEVLTLVRYNRASHSRTSFKKRDETMRSIQKRYYGIPSTRRGATQPLSNVRYGWQEYFYGSKSLARKLWKNTSILKHPRRCVAYLSTFLPEGMFVKFKEWRIRLRFEYLTKFPSSDKEYLNSVLKKYAS
jgi:glycosyltransferase involved in cell wall biosynthesis